MSTSDTSQESLQPSIWSVEEALDLLLSNVRPMADIESVHTMQALGRVLAQSLFSTINVPPADNSAMDGYAVASLDIQADGETRLPVSQRITAGQAGEPLVPGTAARIFTGAPLPAGADAVVMQEYCSVEKEKEKEKEGAGDIVVIRGPLKSGLNVRPAGEDIAKGNQILTAGTRIGPQHMGLAASVGIEELPVYRRARVAVFCTGDELVDPGRSLKDGEIYNSNRYMLVGFLTALGCEVIDIGIVSDDLATTEKALLDASEQADLIITSGGVSVGDEDYVKIAVKQLGQIDMWQIAIKPGKPLAFGNVRETPIMGLPGNPVSLFVTFCLFARPFILRLQGVENVTPKPIPAVVDFEWPKAHKRRQYLRAKLNGAGNGNATIKIYPQQGSGVLTSTGWADGLVVIPEGTAVNRGDTMDFLPFSELLS